MNATSTTATSIIVCFEFPDGSSQNGQITSSNVTHVGTPFDTESQTVSIAITSTEYPLNGSVCGDVIGLQEYNNYTITVVLINSIGLSPSSSDVQGRTLEACEFRHEFIYFHFHWKLFFSIDSVYGTSQLSQCEYQFYIFLCDIQSTY